MFNLFSLVEWLRPQFFLVDNFRKILHFVHLFLVTSFLFHANSVGARSSWKSFSRRTEYPFRTIQASTFRRSRFPLRRFEISTKPPGSPPSISKVSTADSRSRQWREWCKLLLLPLLLHLHRFQKAKGLSKTELHLTFVYGCRICPIFFLGQIYDNPEPKSLYSFSVHPWREFRTCNWSCCSQWRFLCKQSLAFDY